MQAVVKTPRIEIQVRTKKNEPIPPELVSTLKSLFGKKVKMDEVDESVDAFESEFFKKNKAKMKAGDYVRTYRQNKGLNQSELARALGLPRQHVSAMENGTKAIGKLTAKRFSDFFGKPVDRFLYGQEG